MTRGRGLGLRWRHLGVAVVCLLGGCGLLADEPASVVVQSEPEVVMSGGYVVGEDGKLEKPARSVVPEPGFPDEARVRSHEGAVEFAQYYLRLLEYGWDSGDFGQIGYLSSAACVVCEQNIAYVQEMTANGGWVEGLRYYILDTAEPLEFDRPTTAFPLTSVVMKVQTTSFDEYTGSEVRHVDQSVDLVEVQCCWTDGAWEVCGLGSRSVED